ncbi:DNA polymerase IV [Treponema primitia ZAS-2]|uniref:DNA polymerase IV n=1 Tax=Treponema primitia (strain ATCC BAA-887 / DSM 12427 / ZAS-2) TaxID=545694 RepID=F5YJR8_TREPZ|nr:DNA polymerase IV [Treponema primitia]AEF87034.1 DNA polymerase IV [Treponema primitia ZAS-2]
MDMEHGNINRSVCHLNIIGFRAAVAAQKDTSLRGRPFVVAGATGGRALVLDLSPEAMKEGISPGMAKVENLSEIFIFPPNPLIPYWFIEHI